MSKIVPIISLTLLLYCNVSAQFNKMYLDSIGYSGITAGIKENLSTGEYFVPLAYVPGNDTSKFGFLKISPSGTFNELKYLIDTPPPNFYAWSRSFIQTNNNEFVFAGSYNGPFVYKMDSNLDTLWVVNDTEPSSYYCWGGGELGNGDLIFGYTGEGVPWNILEVRRYSSDGELLSNFNVELDYDFSYPSTFITRDSLVYISFPRFLSNNYRRNYIVCYNAITGEEIWETHQIEDDVALGFTDGFMCMSDSGQLRMAYVELAELFFPYIFDQGYQGYIKSLDIDATTGTLLESHTLSELEPSGYIIDATPTDDGGMVILLFAATFPARHLMKVSENMEVEWRIICELPIPLLPGEDVSWLEDVETTSDDCIVAVGTASGGNLSENWYFQHPWVLKVDACGNQVVSDCTLSGLAELGESKQLAVYPNPARDRIFLKAEDAIQHATIFDMNGKIVHNERFSGALEQTLFVDHLPQGLYLVQVTTSAGVVSKRIIIGS